MHIKYMQTYVLIYKLANEKMFFTPNFDKTNQYLPSVYTSVYVYSSDT